MTPATRLSPSVPWWHAGYNTPDLEEIRSVVSEVLSLGPDHAGEALQLENLDEVCG